MNPEPAVAPFSKPLLLGAKFISFVFHPLFVGIMMMFFITYLHPTFFIAVSAKAKLFKFLTFVNNNFVFPVLIVLLLRGLGFSQSVLMKTQKERIVPYIATIIFFFWTFYVFQNQPDSPQVLIDTCQGIFFASCLGLIFNNFFKISMHAIGMGGLIGMMMVIAFSGQAFSFWPLPLAILLTGLVCTARLIVTDHTKEDLFMGLLIGIGTQLLAWWI
jgi:hypothetical protein